MCLFIYFIDSMRQYWEKTRRGVYTEKNKERVKYYMRVEIILIIITLITILMRFTIELIKEKTKLKERFSFIRFFIGLNTSGKVKKIKKQENTMNLFKMQGKCKPGFMKEIDNELKKNIKNSYWTKIKRKISKYI